jgi:hypothetical protein
MQRFPMSRVTLPAAALLMTLISGCDGAENGAASAGRPDGSRAGAGPQATAELERLRALPYAGYVQEEDDQAGDGVVTHDAGRSYPGYTLYSVYEQCLAVLIDEQGSEVNSWRHHPGGSWAHGELLPNGDYLVIGADPSPLPYPKIADESRYVLRFDWSGKLLWKLRLKAHHDIELTPRGQLLTLTFERRLIPEVHAEIPVRDDQLTLLSPAGEVLESISLYDVFAAKPALFPLQRIPPNPLGGEPWVDIFHANSIEWMRHAQLVGRHPIYDPGNVLICFRHQDRIAVVNWERRELVWSWGRRQLSGPHDAQVLASGHILVFDNGLREQRSRVIELDPRSGRIVWSYQAPDPDDFFTPSKGSNQRLPNGNTLIANSDHGQAFEVTPDGEVVWRFLCPHRTRSGRRATIVRAKRYERAFVEHIQQLHARQGEQVTPRRPGSGPDE